MNANCPDCELSIKETGEVIGRVFLFYGLHEGTPDSHGVLSGISMAQASRLRNQATRLLLRRADGRTAEVTIVKAFVFDKAGVVFDHAPFSEPPQEAR